MQDKIKKQKDLIVLRESEGGKIMIEKLRRKVKNAILFLTSEYEEIEEMRLRSMLADINANLNVLKEFNQADDKKKQAEEELEKMVKNYGK